MGVKFDMCCLIWVLGTSNHRFINRIRFMSLSRPNKVVRALSSASLTVGPIFYGYGEIELLDNWFKSYRCKKVRTLLSDSEEMAHYNCLWTFLTMNWLINEEAFIFHPHEDEFAFWRNLQKQKESLQLRKSSEDKAGITVRAALAPLNLLIYHRYIYKYGDAINVNARRRHCRWLRLPIKYELHTYPCSRDLERNILIRDREL